jgi:superfamily II RNA helicase
MDPNTIFNFPLDAFQQDACNAIRRGDNVLVCAKTGSGKTLVGEYQIHKSLSEGCRIFYTTPIKSLSNQKFHDLKHQFPEARVGILTGDIKFCPDAQIVVMTTEILRNLLYKAGTVTEHLGLTANLSLKDLGAVIFDECHYMNDPDRGHVWEETMILLPQTIQMVLLSATLDHPEYLANWLTSIKISRPTQLIQADYRVIPLNHCVLFPSDKSDPMTAFRPESLMLSATGVKEVFNDKTYDTWLRALRNAPQASTQAKASKQSATLATGVTAVTGATTHQSLRPQSFQHTMNEVLEFLKLKQLLPALFFVLSRKNCERYASQVHTDFLDTHEVASVRSIIGFHLSRHMSTLNIMPQWTTLYSLLQRGIAYHHSGLIPQIKEIIELLFSRGLVRLLFCTETFAVGLNMPTKTTIFAGFQKYDEQRDQMRTLRTDEYLQMAGRAGRRGKDKEGWVIYLPDREPLTTQEMRRMMTGGCQTLVSRMELGYDLILKTMLNNGNTDDISSPILDILRKSYWYRLRLTAIENNKDVITRLESSIKASGIDDLTEKTLSERLAAEEAIRTTTNAARKDAQRRLETWKNKHVGPRWENAWKAWKDVRGWRDEIAQLLIENQELGNLTDILRTRLNWLEKNGYIEQQINSFCLTKKGLMATECNESSPLILPEFYLSSLTAELRAEIVKNPNILAVLLSVFLEPINRDTPNMIPSSRMPQSIRTAATTLFRQAGNLRDLDGTPNRSIELSADWMELFWGWLVDGLELNNLCAEYEIFEGNFARAVMKLGNILDEWLSLAMLTSDAEQIEAVAGLRPTLAKDFIIQDSLYLRL